MLEVLYPVNALLMLALPAVAAVLARERLGVGWGLLGVGAATFVLSQVVHIPLNAGVTALFRAELLPSPPGSWTPWLVPLALGVSAGLCEETARYVGYRTALKRVRDWAGGVGYGVGHGGIEALLVGLVALVQVVNLFVLRSMDLDTVGLAPDQAQRVREQVEAAWSAPPWTALAGAFERACTMVCHVGMSVLVLQAVRGSALWLALSIGVHTVLNAGALVALQRGGILAAEGWVLACAIALGLTVRALRDPPAAAPPPTPPEPPVTLTRRPLSTDADRLDGARYR